jgi:putative transposase
MQKLSGGTIYDLSIHLVLVTKYRKKVINVAMLKRLEEIFTDICQKWDCELKEFNGEDDHCHLLIAINPKAQISALANNLKTVSSRRIRQEFPTRCAQFYFKPVFWKMEKANARIVNKCRKCRNDHYYSENDSRRVP